MKKLYWMLSKKYQNLLRKEEIIFQFRNDEIWVNSKDLKKAKKIIGI